jgi:hypothetical protein
MGSAACSLTQSPCSTGTGSLPRTWSAYQPVARSRSCSRWTFPDRALSLVLISTSPAIAGEQPLPPPTAAFTQFAGSGAVDWSDQEGAWTVLAAEIPGAQLLLLEQAGHGIQRDDWDTIVNAIGTHTAVGS